MVTSVMCVDSVTALELHLAIFVSAMTRSIHVLMEWTQSEMCLNDAQDLVTYKFDITIAGDV